MCLQFGSDCIDDCFKGMYKAYVLNCQSVTATKLPHIQFLGNCFIEMFRVDLGAAYQHAFIFIRQLAMILRETTTGTKKVLVLLHIKCGYLVGNCSLLLQPFKKMMVIIK